MDENFLHGVTTTLRDGTRVTFEVHARQAPRRVYPKYGRPYYSTTWREYEAKPRVYVSVPNENLFDNLVNRTSRPHTVWGDFLRQAIRQLEFSGQLRWSQKAGCSCPCSPGFIWTDAPLFNEPRRYDVWVTITGAPTVVEDDPARVARATAIMQDSTLTPQLLSASL